MSSRPRGPCSVAVCGIVVVLVSEVQLFLPDARSLKQKRQVLSSIKERLHNRFCLSAAEVDHADLWQRSTLGLAVVSNSGRQADEVLAKAVNFIETDGRVHIIDYTIEER